MAGTVCDRVGLVTGERRILVKGLSGKVVIDLPIDEVRDAWRRPLMF